MEKGVDLGKDKILGPTMQMTTYHMVGELIQCM